MTIFTQELWHFEINACSSASTVYFVKTKAIAHLLTYATTFSCRLFMSHNEKAWKIKLALKQTKNPVELKHCQTMQLKPQTKGKVVFHFGIRLRHMKTENKMPRSSEFSGAWQIDGGTRYDMMGYSLWYWNTFSDCGRRAKKSIGFLKRTEIDIGYAKNGR